ncbi:MAG: glycoside hydrolase [Acidobacteriia bacterium]|nr:glycoside hydrolase [Terriglobia bacterium]
MTAIITENDEYDPDINPSVGFDRNGVAYIAGDYSSEQAGGVVGIESSRDGVHWSSPVIALSVPDRFTNHSFMVVDDQPGSPFINRLYVSTVLVGPPDDNSKNRVAVSHSSDGGSTWTVVPVGPEQTFPASDEFTDMTIGRDGTVYVAWQHCSNVGADAGCRNRKVYTLFSKSTDGGNTWSSPRVIAKIDRGTTLCQCASGILPNSNTIRVYNYPALGIDNSNGPYGGTVYVAMYSWTGTYMRVGVIRSTDGGDSWFKPVPIAPASANHDQFFPWLSVSPTGLVGVSWLDRRNDPANVKYQAFAAISTDGGKTFQPNIQLTTAFSDPNRNGYPQNGWMGDYSGNTWAGPNNFVAAWMDSSNGVDMQDVVGGIRLK